MNTAVVQLKIDEERYFNNHVLLWSGKFSGRTYSKANSRRLVFNKRTQRIMFIKSKEAIEFTESFFQQIAKPKETITCEVILVCRIWYQSRRSDLDESLVMDVLQKRGVIANDRLIREKHIYGDVDPDNPRVEMELYSL